MSTDDTRAHHRRIYLIRPARYRRSQLSDFGHVLRRVWPQNVQIVTQSGELHLIGSRQRRSGRPRVPPLDWLCHLRRLACSGDSRACWIINLHRCRSFASLVFHIDGPSGTGREYGKKVLWPTS
jgi:hypothetical protein